MSSMSEKTNREKARKTTVTVGFSLSPETESYVRRRAAEAGFGLSRYLQTLIEYDQNAGILSDALEFAARRLRPPETQS